MSSRIYGAALEVEEGETLSLAETVQYKAVKPGYEEVKMYCASQWRIAHCPKLLNVLTYASSTFTDYTTEATDGVSSTHVPLDAMAATTYLYLGVAEPVSGFYFNVGSNVNAETATLDWEYCSTALADGVSIAFTDVAGDSDGTDSGGATLAQDGAYTFTAIADGTIKRSALGKNEPYGVCYWYRFKPSASLSATVDINEIIPIYKNTNYGYREAGIEYTWTINNKKTGGYALLATSGTPTLDITWMKHG